jgi:predicted dehydrogenase
VTDERLVGYGVVGINTRVRRTILNGIAKSSRARLAAVCSRDEGKARQTTTELGGTPYTALADLLADPAVDVVFICTPHALHRPMAIEALRAGKLVICEKPLALRLDEADEMADAAREAGRPNLVNFTYHSLPGPRFVERLLREQTIGRLLHLDFSYWQARQRLPGAVPASALLDVGSHQVDLAHWWCEAGGAGVIAEVTAQELASTELGVPIFSALARTSGGSMVTIQANRAAAGWKNGMVGRFVGEHGTITLTFDTDQTTVELARFGDGSAEGIPRVLRLPTEFEVSYADFPVYHIDRLTAALLGEIDFPDFAYGRRCQALLEAIHTSAEQHRWVEIG